MELFYKIAAIIFFIWLSYRVIRTFWREVRRFMSIYPRSNRKLKIICGINTGISLLTCVVWTIVLTRVLTGQPIFEGNAFFNVTHLIWEVVLWFIYCSVFLTSINTIRIAIKEKYPLTKFLGTLVLVIFINAIGLWSVLGILYHYTPF